MTSETIHATTVALGESRGLLILGPSGSGKSGLALQLLALGADLVADDRTILTAGQGELIATCPPALSGLIEARGIGLLRSPPLPRARVVLAVDLAQTEPERLPPHRSFTLMGTKVDLVLRGNSDHFASALLCYLKGGRGA